jgi:hypothetical protein
MQRHIDKFAFKVGSAETGQMGTGTNLDGLPPYQAPLLLEVAFWSSETRQFIAEDGRGGCCTGSWNTVQIWLTPESIPRVFLVPLRCRLEVAGAGSQMLAHDIFVECHSKTRSVRYIDPPMVHDWRLDSFLDQG